MSNNEMYRLYNEMVKGYKENQDGLFEHAVRCWLDLDPVNPFPEEDPAYEEFFLMKKGYTIWKMGNADRKINRRRMLEHARKLCELNPKRPYKFDKKEEEAKQAAEAEKARLAKEAAAKKAEEEAEKARCEEELKRETTKFNEEFNRHVLGVLPDEQMSGSAKKYMFGIIPQTELAIEEDEEEEPKKSFFGKLFKKKNDEK